jgi:hypothetical protein
MSMPTMRLRPHERAAPIAGDSGQSRAVLGSHDHAHILCHAHNNPLERIMREIRRRTRVAGAFPDGQSALNLAAARLNRLSRHHPYPLQATESRFMRPLVK